MTEAIPLTHDVHRIGHCLVCCQQLAEIRDIYPAGTLKGWPKRIGMWFDMAHRCTVQLMSGAATDWTVCELCVPKVDQQLPRLHRKIVDTFQFEFETAPWRGVQTYTTAQVIAFNALLKRTYEDKPLGVRSVTAWKNLSQQMI